MEMSTQPLTHRQRQALATRQLIIEAARDLFLEQGYGTVTVEAISARAGVAVSTVYAIFKNKRGILKAIREAWHQESGQRDIYTQAIESQAAETCLNLAAHATRRQWETSAVLIPIYLGAAAVDVEAAAELQSALDGRRANLRRFIEAAAPLLRADLSIERLLAVYLALTKAEVYQELVSVFGWTPDEYEQWLAETLNQQLLA